MVAFLIAGETRNSERTSTVLSSKWSENTVDIIGAKPIVRSPAPRSTKLTIHKALDREVGSSTRLSNECRALAQVTVVNLRLGLSHQLADRLKAWSLTVMTALGSIVAQPP
jgi:hypothetical protein